jgi:hypothetical protein
MGKTLINKYPCENYSSIFQLLLQYDSRDRKRQVSVPFNLSSSTQLEFEYDMKRNYGNPYYAGILAKPSETRQCKSKSVSLSQIFLESVNIEQNVKHINEIRKIARS